MHFLFFSRAKTTKLFRKICLNCTSCPISYIQSFKHPLKNCILLLSIFNFNNESAVEKYTLFCILFHKRIGHQNDKKKVNKNPRSFSTLDRSFNQLKISNKIILKNYLKKLKLLLRSSLKLDHPQIIVSNFNFVTSTIRKRTKIRVAFSFLYHINLD